MNSDFPSPERPERRRLARREAMLALGALLAGCQVRPGARDEPPEHRSQTRNGPKTTIVLVAIDGVRFQDVFLGPTPKGHEVARCRTELVPHLVAMERSGVALGGPNSPGFFASGPNFVSLPGYMEMLSGTSATGCTENDCQRMTRRTLLDDFERSADSNRARAAAFSSWRKIGIAASTKERGIASTGRDGGYGLDLLQQLPASRRAYEQGLSDAGGWGDLRRDRVTAHLARTFLYEAEPDFMFVSLGETDEHAHHGDYRAYLQALKEADQFVGALRMDLEARRAAGERTLLLVTTDHGRAFNFNDHGRRFPESSRSFLFAEGSFVSQGHAAAEGPAYLKDIAPSIRSAVGLASSGDEHSGRVLRCLSA